MKKMILVCLCFLSWYSSSGQENKDKEYTFGEGAKNPKTNVFPVGILSRSDVRVSGINITTGQYFDAKNVTINGVSISVFGSGIWQMMGSYHKTEDWTRDSFEIIVNGLNFGSVFGDVLNGQVNGIMLGGFFNEVNEVNGLVLGISNTLLDCNGITISLANDAQIMNGLQLGVGNSSKRVNGIQLGLFNYTESGKVVQIGLINKVGRRIIPIINFNWN